MGSGCCVIKNKPICFGHFYESAVCINCKVSSTCRVNTPSARPRGRKKTPKHAIKSDEVLNPSLKKEVQEVRGMIVGTAESHKLPSNGRFEVTPCEDQPSMVIHDLLTGRKSIVPLFAYGEVRRVLGELFEVDE